MVEGCRGDGFYIVVTECQGRQGNESIEIGVNQVRYRVVAEVQAGQTRQSVQSSFPCTKKKEESESTSFENISSPIMGMLE